MRGFWLLAAAALTALPACAAAQTAVVSAIATVTPVGLSVGFDQELAFGTVLPGVATTLDPNTAPTAGHFEIHGARNAEIQIMLTLPAVLVLGPASVPITFGPTGGCHRNRNRQDQCTYFDPSAPLTVRIRNQNPPDNHYHVWVGGTVTPAAALQGGAYAADLTLTVAYTGN